MSTIETYTESRTVNILRDRRDAMRETGRHSIHFDDAIKVAIDAYREGLRTGRRSLGRAIEVSLAAHNPTEAVSGDSGPTSTHPSVIGRGGACEGRTGAPDAVQRRYELAAREG